MSRPTQGVIVYHASDAATALSRAIGQFGSGLRADAVGGSGRPPALGELRRVGVDACGRRVFALARGDLGRVAERALAGIAALFGFGEDRVVLIDADEPPRRRAARGRGAAADAAPPPWSADLLGIARDSPWPTVVYTCFGSAHSSVVAAALHAGLLPFGRRPSAADVLALPDFDRLCHAEIGRPLPIGRDSAGRLVVALGLMSGRTVLPRAIYDLLAVFGLPTGALVFVDALTGASLGLRVGGFLSRRLGWVRLGRPLCVAAVRREYPRFERVVGRVWRQVGARALAPWTPAGGRPEGSVLWPLFDGDDAVANNNLDMH